ncbi:MAG: transcriptional regulator NrdR [Candidatus Woesearchaeota archaeon]
MKCPFCYSEKTRVIDKRETNENKVVRRRRECQSCNERFTTYERIEKPSLLVLKKNGSEEHFNREKLMSGVIKACEKRDVSLEKIKQLVNKVQSELLKDYNSKVNSKTIGKIVSSKLKKLDSVAYMRFASVYKDFESIDSFERELELLKDKNV